MSKRVLVAVLVVVTSVVAAVSMVWGEQLRFTVSSGGMEDVARTLQVGEELREQDIGGLSFELVRNEDGLVYFYRGRDLDGSGRGYVWSPERRVEAKHLGGPWYELVDDAHQSPSVTPLQRGAMRVGAANP
ncbi:hypothetical protein [Nonomuraea longicatena]|uniref:Uncharacterized protein n=1 Tax=Nonomuraea longicatena TaxID=83682 RepID=A0ABP4A0N1_9ACTN